jgi:hypothetical protein
MRLLVLVSVVSGVFSSSCVAVGVTAGALALRASDEERQEVEGYERLLALRVHEARTAAVIRERWNAANASPLVAEASPLPATVAPMAGPEAPRRPLRPAAR